MSKKGFTLIELLIVVAIIAILAAIAIPNFLEAQTRAKVSRVKADLRTLGMAVESYSVDWNQPPIFNMTNVRAADTWAAVHYVLTTPIAYITSLPLNDPFPHDRLDLFFRQEIDYYEFFGTTSSVGRDIHGFYFRSNGPDHFKGTKLRGLLAGTLTWEELESGGAASPWYDPTNGTVSTGDIIRTRAIVDNKPAGIREK